MAYPPANIPADAADSTQANGYLAARLNTLATAVDAVVTALGSSPAGSYADLTTRLGALSVYNIGLLFVRPEDYGAHRDGVTNDAAAISAAMTVAAAKGYALLLSPGTYAFTPSAQINVPPSVRVVGAGATLQGPWTSTSWFQLNSGSTLQGVTLASTSGTSGSVPLITVAASAVGPTVEGCQFTSAAGDVVNGIAISALQSGLVNLAVRRCSFAGFGTDVYVSNTSTGATGVEVSDCTLTGALWFIGTTAAVIQRVRLLRNSWTYAPTTVNTVRLQYTLSARVEDCMLTLTTSASTLEPFILLGTVNTRIRNNTISATTGPLSGAAVIHTYSGATDLRIEGNAFNIGDATHGFTCVYTEDAYNAADRFATAPLRITDNWIVGAGTAPLIILQAYGLRTMVNNNTAAGGGYFLQVNASRDLVVRGNAATGLASGAIDFEESGTVMAVLHEIADNYFTGVGGQSLAAGDINQGSTSEPTRGESTITRKQSHGTFTSDSSGAWAAYTVGLGRAFTGILRVVAVRSDGNGRISSAWRVTGQFGQIITAVQVPGTGVGNRGTYTMTAGGVTANGSNGLRVLGNVGQTAAGIVVEWWATFEGLVSINSGSTTGTSSSASDGTVTGSRGSIGALANLLTVLANQGIVQDGTTS